MSETETPKARVRAEPTFNFTLSIPHSVLLGIDAMANEEGLPRSRTGRILLTEALEARSKAAARAAAKQGRAA